MTSFKMIAFRVILLLPLATVLLFAGFFVSDVKKIRSVTEENLRTGLTAYLSAREPVSFPPPEGFSSLDDSESNIFVFGASSTVISDSGVFSQYLEQMMNQNGLSTRRVRVTNFGVSGIDSRSVALRVRQALEYSGIRPAILLVYFGHNDYTNAYRMNIVRHFDSFNSFLRVGYLLRRRKLDFRGQLYGFGQDRYPDFSWYALFNRAPFLEFVQRLGLFRVDSGSFRALNEEILASFGESTERILQLASARGIPLVFITPVGNLRARPYGGIHDVTAPYRLGLQESSYRRSIAYLTEARDNEIFTGDIRAKSPLVEYLRGLDNGRDVFVLDLETAFISSESDFGDEMFLDYFHFTDKAHRTIADLIEGKILSHQALLEAMQGT